MLVCVNGGRSMSGFREHGSWLLPVLVLVVFGCCGVLAEDGYPRKPVKVVVPFGAGGGSDTFVRIVQKAVRDGGLLGQPMVVLNVPGAGGTVGSRRVRDALADGYTILNLHEGILTAKHSGLALYGAEAFEPIAATGRGGLVICVKEGSGFEGLGDLVERARAGEEPVLFGMAPGTPTQFAGLRLEEVAGGAGFRFVVSGGGAKRFNDLVGGHIDVTPFSFAEYSKFRDAGVRALAYLGEARHADAAELSTAREQGFDLVMEQVQYWWAPKGTPAESVGVLADVLEEAMRSGYVRTKLAELKIEPLFLRGDELVAHLEVRDRRLRDVALVSYDSVPDIVPSVVVVVFLLGGLSLVGLVRDGRGDGVRFEGGRRVVVMLAGVGAYVAVMQVVGVPFAWATMVAVPVFGWLVGGCPGGRLVRLAAVGGVVGWGCFLVLTKFLVIDLP